MKWWRTVLVPLLHFHIRNIFVESFILWQFQYFWNTAKANKNKLLFPSALTLFSVLTLKKSTHTSVGIWSRRLRFTLKVFRTIPKLSLCYLISLVKRAKIHFLALLALANENAARNIALYQYHQYLHTLFRPTILSLRILYFSKIYITISTTV